jgi:hypothetical protein
MPEGILPYVLHLLSYHPDFPESSAMETEADKKRCRNIAKNLRMVINALTQSLGEDSNNLSFLLKQVGMIDQHYDDATGACVTPHNPEPDVSAPRPGIFR